MIYAHQGGWDEILMVLAPVAGIVFLLWLAKRRADRTAADRSATEAENVDNVDDV